jgi:hypothetical protein
MIRPRLIRQAEDCAQKRGTELGHQLFERICPCRRSACQIPDAADARHPTNERFRGRGSHNKRRHPKLFKLRQASEIAHRRDRDCRMLYAGARGRKERVDLGNAGFFRNRNPLEREPASQRSHHLIDVEDVLTAGDHADFVFARFPVLPNVLGHIQVVPGNRGAGSPRREIDARDLLEMLRSQRVTVPKRAINGYEITLIPVSLRRHSRCTRDCRLKSSPVPADWPVCSPTSHCPARFRAVTVLEARAFHKERSFLMNPAFVRVSYSPLIHFVRKCSTASATARRKSPSPAFSNSSASTNLSSVIGSSRALQVKSRNSTLAERPDGQLNYIAALHCGSSRKLHHNRGR